MCDLREVLGRNTEQCLENKQKPHLSQPLLPAQPPSQLCPSASEQMSDPPEPRRNRRLTELAGQKAKPLSTSTAYTKLVLDQTFPKLTHDF